MITNRDAYRCSARNSSGAARPCGAAAPRNGDAHGARLRSEGSLLLSDVPSVHAKMAKYALLTAARAEVPNRAKRSEGSDSAPPPETPPVSPCEPLCAILLAKASVYPLSPVKTNVRRLCECDSRAALERAFPLPYGTHLQRISDRSSDYRRILSIAG